MTLYQINDEILNVLSKNIDENGEITDAGLDALTALEMAKSEKIESVALWIKDLTAENEAMKAEIETFRARLKTNEGKIDTLKAWLTTATDGVRFSTPRCQVSFRSSTAVEILDMDKIPEGFTRIKTEISPDKTKIKAVLQSGGMVEGARLKNSKNVIVK